MKQDLLQGKYHSYYTPSPISICVENCELAVSAGLDFASMLSLTGQMAIVYGAAQMLDNFLLQPYIYSQSVKAHPLEIFLVILMAGNVAGIAGMILAVPTYSIGRVFVGEFFNQFKVVKALTGEG